MKGEILDYLSENDLDDLQEIRISKENIFVVKINYYFDELELQGAESYADEECAEGKASYEYYEEYVIPYLSDMAIDNVEDIIKDISEDLDLEYELISFDLDPEDYEINSFVVAFYKDEDDFELEDYITEIL